MKDDEYRVKKLALAYHTGWEYLPGEAEAGSVITDIFLGLLEDNRERYRRIWDKQERSFLRVAPLGEGEAGRLRTALCVRAPGGADGEVLSEKTPVYTVWEDEVLMFAVTAPLRLTAAALKYAVCRKGRFAWLVWEGEGMIPLFRPSGRLLDHPVFRWRVDNLCNGLDGCRFLARMEVPGGGGRLGGRWSITDTRHRYPLEGQKGREGWEISGETPEYAKNLRDTEYEIVLELPCPEGEEGWEEAVRAFEGGLSLSEPELSLEPDVCLTDLGAEEGGRIFPFGNNPDEASCCYLACDAILARRSTQITLKFKESFLIEEELPPQKPEGYGKIYRKYPWLGQFGEVRDWKVSESVWEYFDGEMWRGLPGTGRETGCAAQEGQAGERGICWTKPADMEACSIEGREHFYIRLRTVKVAGAYAAYYRKYTPVLEDIRFTAPECIWECAGRDDGGGPADGAEKMYLGFDRAVTPDNCWYARYQGADRAEGAAFSFDEGRLAGWGRRFGMEAFWVELGPGWPQDGPGLPEGMADMELLSNYVEVLQVPGTPDTECKRHRREVPRGTKFYVEAQGAGPLDASSLTDAYYDGRGAPYRTGVAEAENFFSRCGRLVTPMDIKMLFEERYPEVRMLSCRFAEDARELLVTLGQHPPGGRLSEIKQWLEEEIRRDGSLWLCGSRVRIQAPRQGEETDAGGNEAG